MHLVGQLGWVPVLLSGHNIPTVDKTPLIKNLKKGVGGV